MPDTDAQKKVIQNFIHLYTDVYHFDKQFPINTHSGYAWDAISIVANAMRKAGTDPKALRAAIEETKGYVGVSGIYTLSPGGPQRPGPGFHGYHPGQGRQVRDGEIKPRFSALTYPPRGP